MQVQGDPLGSHEVRRHSNTCRRLISQNFQIYLTGDFPPVCYDGLQKLHSRRYSTGVFFVDWWMHVWSWAISGDSRRRDVRICSHNAGEAQRDHFLTAYEHGVLRSSLSNTCYQSHSDRTIPSSPLVMFCSWAWQSWTDCFVGRGCVCVCGGGVIAFRPYDISKLLLFVSLNMNSKC